VGWASWTPRTSVACTGTCDSSPSVRVPTKSCFPSCASCGERCRENNVPPAWTVLLIRAPSRRSRKKRNCEARNPRILSAAHVASLGGAAAGGRPARVAVRHCVPRAVVQRTCLACLRLCVAATPRALWPSRATSLSTHATRVTLCGFAGAALPRRSSASALGWCMVESPSCGAAADAGQCEPAANRPLETSPAAFECLPAFLMLHACRRGRGSKCVPEPRSLRVVGVDYRCRHVSGRPHKVLSGCCESTVGVPIVS
jgi:hypothetical protein